MILESIIADPNIDPAFKRALGADALDEYIAALRAFDWHYQAIDDGRAYAAAVQRLAHLYELQAQVDPSGVIWMEHRPTGDVGPCAPLPKVVV